MKDTGDTGPDPDSLPRFTLPESFLRQLYDFTGSTEDNRGFCLAYVNQHGEVMIYQKVESQIIDLGLRKAIEKYLVDMEESEGRIDLSEGEA